MTDIDEKDLRTTNIKPLIIYHGKCPDGFCAAWVASCALGEVELYPALHGREAPPVSGREVYILDFSYPRDVLEKMYEDAASLLVLDHHKTAEADLRGLEYCKFDMNESGASLTWNHFFPDEEAPWLVQYVRDRDLWLWELPKSKEIAATVMSMDHDLDTWTEMSKRPLNDAVQQGKAVRDHIEHYISAVLPMSFPVEIDGIKMACVNVPYPNVSDVLDAFCKGGTPAALGFFWARDRWQYSLRSVGDIDISEVAKKRDGGGHKNAAGFQSGCVLIPEVMAAMAKAQ